MNNFFFQFGMKENQRFRRADSRKIFVRVSHGHYRTEGPIPPSAKAFTRGTELQSYLVSCFVYLVKPLTKGIIQTKAFQFI